MNAPAALVAVDEYRAIVAQLIVPPEARELPLVEAIGLRLAAPVTANSPLPGFDNSGMDGYAVRAADVAGASAEQPVALPVAGEIPAGTAPAPLSAGTAHRIMTGAPVPPGADAIVPVEATDAGRETVTIFEERAVGMHVRPAGSDVAVGTVVLEAGTVLGAAQVGLLAALGTETVSVVPRLRVLVVTTGDELAAPGEQLTPAKLYDANGALLTAALREAGVQDITHLRMPDNQEVFREVVGTHARNADLILTSGGVSAGAYEVVKDSLSDGDVRFLKVAMQPGMPQGCGLLHGVPVVCLPGNPVSSLVSYEVFVRPAVRAALGCVDVARPVAWARLTEAVDSIPGKRQMRRGVLNHQTGEVQPWGPPGSHFLRWFAQANALFVLPEDVTALAAGAQVETWDLTRG